MQADKAVHGFAEEARTRHCADSDITREDIVKILDNSCGSHKPQKYIFGPGDEVQCQE